MIVMTIPLGHIKEGLRALLVGEGSALLGLDNDGRNIICLASDNPARTEKHIYLCQEYQEIENLEGFGLRFLGEVARTGYGSWYVFEALPLKNHG